MFLRRVLNLNYSRFSQVYRRIHRSTIQKSDEQANKDISGSVATKFQVFQNESGIIFDIEEERRRQEENNVYEDQQIFPSPYEGINLERKIFNEHFLKLFSYKNYLQEV